jgi:hypothetical protein
VVVSARSIERVLAAHVDALMALPGVLGVAQGRCEGEPCIRVFVFDTSVAAQSGIPERLDGFLVRVEVTGRFVAD